MSNLVAVYGSLLSGLHNHPLIKHCRMVGKSTIRGKMYSLGGFPGLKLASNLDVDNRDYIVEVYEVDDATLGRLDALEGHPNFYRRFHHPFVIGEQTAGGEQATRTVYAWVYEWQGNAAARNPIVTDESWRSHYHRRYDVT